MEKVGSRLIAEKALLVVTFLTVLVVAPYWVMDPMNLPKMTLLSCLAFFTAGLIFPLISKDYFRTRKALLLLVIFWIIDLLLILFLSGRNFNLNLYGVSGRNTGVLTYFAFGLVLLVSSTVSDQEFLKKFRKMFIVLGLILSAYGLIQYFGFEPFPYINAYENNVFGTFGNPNFQSAFLGILGALLFVAIFDRDLEKSWRVISTGLLAIAVIEIKLTNSWQGFFNLAAGIGVAVILILYKLNFKKVATVVLSLGVFIFVSVGLALLNQGPLSALIAKSSLVARRVYWEAAANILFQNPVFGSGLDGFGDWFRRGRSAKASEVNANLIADSAHSVPLDIASGGGFPLLFLYFGFFTLALVSIIRVTRTSEKNNFLFISLAAAWASYHAQSLISINQIGIGVIGWVITGLIIGYAIQPVKTSESHSNSLSKATKAKYKIHTVTIVPGIVGLLIGTLVALPPYIAANRFYEGLKTSDARVIATNAYLRPLDLRRMIVAADILERNRFFKESLEITRAANKAFPDSFDTWGFLANLTQATESDKSQAKKEQLRLDPNLKR